MNFTQKIKALDLVKQPRFNELNSVVKDNVDTASIKYPKGSTGFLSLEDFQDQYKNQVDSKTTYSVKLPTSKLAYKQGQVRMVRPEFCIENFQLFNNSVDFCESENPVVFYDEKSNDFDVVKKQHTTAQIAAIANATGKDIEVVCRVVAFNPNVSAKERSVEGSKVFFKEIVGINKTQDWEALPHEVALGKDLSIKLVNLYKSIPNLTWQPINYAFPSIESPKYTITKVAQMKKLFSYAINDDEVDTLRNIIQTICNTVQWKKEKPSKEISVYLLRALYNFEKRLTPLLEDTTGSPMGGIGFQFDLLDHIENYFSIYTTPTYLGSTRSDKQPWMHLVKAAGKVNDYIIREMGDPFDGKPFFHVKKAKFVDAIDALANPTSRKSVEMSEIKRYITAFCG